MYPIPPPDASTLEKIFGSIDSADAMDLTNLANLKPAAAVEPKETMAIFELLDYIVNEPPPKLEHRIFSAEFKDFVDRCLKKNPDERADLKTLIVSASEHWLVRVNILKTFVYNSTRRVIRGYERPKPKMSTSPAGCVVRWICRRQRRIAIRRPIRRLSYLPTIT